MVIEKVKELIAEHLDIDKKNINDNSHLINDFQADSLDIVQMLIALESEFNVEFKDEEIKGLKTVKDVAEFIEKKR